MRGRHRGRAEKHWRRWVSVGEAVGSAQARQRTRLRKTGRRVARGEKLSCDSVERHGGRAGRGPDSVQGSRRWPRRRGGSAAELEVAREAVGGGIGEEREEAVGHEEREATTARCLGGARAARFKRRGRRRSHGRGRSVGWKRVARTEAAAGER